MTPHKGHCRCGGVAIEVSSEPKLSVYCHCDDCRRSAGAPVIASVGFEKLSVTWQADETLETYVEGTCTRLFCRNCGSPVAQKHLSAPDMIFFNTGFMDDPEAFPPTYHTFAGQKLSWLKLTDDLPKNDKTILIRPGQTA